jgi:hypothetical protein
MENVFKNSVRVWAPRDQSVQYPSLLIVTIQNIIAAEVSFTKQTKEVFSEIKSTKMFCQNKNVLYRRKMSAGFKTTQECDDGCIFCDRLQSITLFLRVQCLWPAHQGTGWGDILNKAV